MLIKIIVIMLNLCCHQSALLFFSLSLFFFFSFFFFLVFEIKLGTVDQAEVNIEWRLRPYMNTAKKRQALSSAEITT